MNKKHTYTQAKIEIIDVKDDDFVITGSGRFGTNQLDCDNDLGNGFWE